MSRIWLGAALALGAAAACNGEFRFDRTSASSAGANAVLGTGGGGAVSAGVAGYDDANEHGAGGVRDENGCAHCADFGLKCATEWESCVECVDNDDCTTAERPYCDPELHRCAPCNADNDGCDAGYTCDGWSHTCVRTCDTGSEPGLDCDGGPRMCKTSRNECIVCTDSDDCHDPSHPYCAWGGVACAECANDGNCANGWHCDQLSWTCVACRDSMDCAVGSVCDPIAQTCVDASSTER